MDGNSNNDKVLNIDNMINLKGENEKEGGFNFTNREEFTEELSKWNEIIKENIYIYQQYLLNLSTISKLFNTN